ncbi:hypothetical protein P1J78_17110 [Psychromarinibacter sp. C21-152]|uniref:Uncharacterized protein n=1 Tax=Psychromarinibacter sediminicola TaxID=3033385 RepID=A0AAE3NVJ3_9RHOB|nr:hypothetical protein [Psychromarinibacter sediminicola]MDF0602459.1 hypothetical protein [Psychromarinibacter sediminicola]
MRAFSRFRLRLTVTTAALTLAGAAAALPIEDRLAELRAAYDAEVAKNVIDLQLYRHSQEAVLPDGKTKVELINLNPNINSWFLLGLGEGNGRSWFHLENPAPDDRALSLEQGADGPEILITEGKRTHRCTPWAGEPSMLSEARRANLPYAPVCGDRLYLRVQTGGSYTSLEATSQFLRDHVWGGDAIVTWVKATLNKDKYALLDGELGTGGEDDAAAHGPPPAKVRHAEGQRPLVAQYHTFDLEGAEGGMATGLWYPVEGQDGVFVSALQPQSIAQEVMDVPGANWLDGVESRAINYFVAFDLSRFDLGFARGTDHPRLGWSPRPPAYVRPRGMPGPDGFTTAAPLVSLGMASPYLTDRITAAFTAGFKRQHGAFRGGPYRDANYGSHYGFLEHGVILSKLWPGLSTVYVTQDGEIGMKTWEESDYEKMPNLRFARQNGTPLVEDGKPGPYVTQWLPGNWSGSANADLRTLRAGACLIEQGDTQYLVYAYFSTATPSAMTRSFMAYDCTYGMLLDMNALEHTYMGLYSFNDGGGIEVDHIMRGMSQLDKRGSSGVIPRFIGYPDNRDVFYLIRKE